MQLAKLLVSFFMFFALFGCKQRANNTNRPDFKSYYDSYGVTGIFVLYDSQKDCFTFYNEQLFNTPFSPASTFKICNSLIGLETGVIKDENFVIPWDSVVRKPLWDKDHDLKLAYKNSTVWYYQELARRVGAKDMNYWIHKANYGNADTAGGIDKFWLWGGLKISAAQQIDFLKRLHDGKLDFSDRSCSIVKKMMIEKDTLNYILRSKTGWGNDHHQDIGWYVGYIEKENKVYYFANCVLAETKTLENIKNVSLFDHARRGITFKILKELKILN